MTTYYVSGKMRGIPRYNFPQFDSLSEWLRQSGYGVINPADHDREVEPDVETQAHFLAGDPSLKQGPGNRFPELIGWDLRMIASPECDGIVMLPGWEDSEGARHERYVAEACQKQVFLANRHHATGEWYITLDSDQRRLAGAQYGPAAEVLSYGELKVTDEPRVGKLVLVDRPVYEVIGLVGYAQVGKDTLAAQLVENEGFERLAFADTLRECLYALDPLIPVIGKSTGQVVAYSRLSNVVDRYGWDIAKTQMPEVRELLQRLGTEVGREILGNDIWVDTTLAKVRPGGKYVITDVRFPNEFAAIEKLGGTTLRILRPGKGPVNGHWSETALDGYKTDALVWNTGSPDDLLVNALRALNMAVPSL